MGAGSASLEQVFNMGLESVLVKGNNYTRG